MQLIKIFNLYFIFVSLKGVDNQTHFFLTSKYLNYLIQFEII